MSDSRYWLLLGSNVRPEQALAFARHRLQQRHRLLAASDPLWSAAEPSKSPPAPPYLNQGLVLASALEVSPFRDELKRIEQDFGPRLRGVEIALDVDLLLAVDGGGRMIYADSKKWQPAYARACLDGLLGEPLRTQLYERLASGSVPGPGRSDE